MENKFIQRPNCSAVRAKVTYIEDGIYRLECGACKEMMLHREKSWDAAVKYFKWLHSRKFTAIGTEAQGRLSAICATYGIKCSDRLFLEDVLEQAESLAEISAQIYHTGAPDESPSNAGLYSKYNVYKADNGDAVGNCFVLRPDKDPIAIIALRAYAATTSNAALASDIMRWVRRLENKPLTTAEVASAYLDICDRYCAGDNSTGIHPCPFWDAPDVGAFGEVLPGACRLELKDWSKGGGDE